MGERARQKTMPSTVRCSRIAFSGQTLSSSSGVGDAAGGLLVEHGRPARPAFDEHDAARRAALGDQLAGQLAVLVVHERIVEDERAVGDDDHLAVAPAHRRRSTRVTSGIAVGGQQRLESSRAAAGRCRVTSRFVGIASRPSRWMSVLAGVDPVGPGAGRAWSTFCGGSVAARR